MSDDTLSRYTQLVDSKSAVSDEPETDAGPCVGLRRQAAGLAFMFDLHFLTGNRQAYPYSHILDVAESGGTTIVISLTSAKVTITGRRLATVYDRLIDQRVAWLQEIERSDRFTDGIEEVPLIESIVVESG